jgi:hypothetical protein
MESVKQPGLRRGTALREHRQLAGRLFILQMRQNPLDNPRVFNTGDDLDTTRTAFAGLDGAATGSMSKTRLSRCIQVIDL